MLPKFDAHYEMLMRSVSDRTPNNEDRWLGNSQNPVNDPVVDNFDLNGFHFIVKSETNGNYYFFIADEAVAFYEGFILSDGGIETKMIYTKKGRFNFSLMYHILKWILSRFTYIKTGMIASTDAITFLKKNFNNFISEGYTFFVHKEHGMDNDIPLIDINKLNNYATPSHRIKIYPPKA